MIVGLEISVFFRNFVDDFFSFLFSLRAELIKATVESLWGRLVGDGFVEHQWRRPSF